VTSITLYVARKMRIRRECNKRVKLALDSAERGGHTDEGKRMKNVIVAVAIAGALATA